MTMLGLAGQILMQVPAQHRRKLLMGTVKLTGSVLRDTKTGRIVGFLQEAAPIAGPLSQRLSGPARKFTSVTAATGNPAFGAVTAGADLAMQAGQLVQGEAIRSGVNRVEQGVGRLEHGMARVDDKLDGISDQVRTLDKGMELLQNLGVANLAMNAAGLGVSMVGFGIMSIKLDRVQASIHAISDHLDTISTKIDRLRQDAVDADFVEIHSLCRLYEEGWDFKDRGRSEQQWLRIAHEARTFQDRFAWRARELLTASPSNAALADPMLDALSLASGLRVTSLVACNESRLACNVSSEAAVQLEALTGSIGLYELSAKEIPRDVEAGSTDYELVLVRAREAARPLLQKIRHREAVTATRTAPLPLLEKRGVAPREWLETARNERQTAVLMFSVEDEEAGEDAVCGG
nr:hypothetical protein [uncultured Novosphingobium sp.]